MPGKSDYLEAAVLDHLYRTASLSKPGVLYVGLLVADAGFWAATTAYSLDDYVCPTVGNYANRIFKCTTPGTSGGTEPTWPTTDGGTVSDGTAEWTDATADFDDGSVPEVSGGSYARVQRDPSDANWNRTGNEVSNATVITFPSPTADWGVAVAAITADASSAGNRLHTAMLTTPKLISNGDDDPFIDAGDLDISET